MKKTIDKDKRDFIGTTDAAAYLGRSYRAMTDWANGVVATPPVKPAHRDDDGRWLWAMADIRDALATNASGIADGARISARKRPWTDGDIAMLREVAGKMPVGDIARQLGRGIAAVKSAANIRGISTAYQPMGDKRSAKKSEQEKTLRNVIAKMAALEADFEKMADTPMVKERRERLAYEFDIEYRHLGRRVRIIEAELAAIPTRAKVGQEKESKSNEKETLQEAQAKIHSRAANCMARNCRCCRCWTARMVGIGAPIYARG